jgi:gluconolactonase
MLFAPPKDLETTVFARIPDKFRIKGKPSPWVKVQQGGRETDCFLEGPSFDLAGNLYVVDVAYGRVFRISPNGGDIELVTDYDGEPNGLKIHKDGRIFLADYKNGIMLLDPDNGDVTPFLTRNRLEPFKGVNDLVFASNGDLFFTDQGLTGWHDPTGCLYRYTSDGRLDCLIDTVPSPNGLVLSLDENICYLNVTRAQAVWRVPLLSDGGTFKVGTFLQLSGGGHGGPDGLAIDEAGNLVVAHVGMGSVWVFSPLGEPLYRIRSCEGLATTNIAYGGPERRTLYITESETGCILKCELPTPGRLMYSHM